MKRFLASLLLTLFVALPCLAAGINNPPAGVSTSGANTWSGNQTFEHQKLRINDSGNDHTITIESAANNAANRTMQLPALSGTDTFATLGANQTFTGNVTFTGTVTGAGGLPAGFSGNPSKHQIFYQVGQLTDTNLTSTGAAAAPTHAGLSASILLDTTGTYFNSASSGSSGGDFGFYSGVNQFRRDQVPEATFTVKTGTVITNLRTWVGFASTASTMLSQDLPGSGGSSLHCAAFRYNTGVDGTAFWRTVTADGSAETVTTTTAAVTTNTRYILRIVTSASDVKFYVDGTLVATHTTNLPGASTNLQWLAAGETTEASGKSFRVARCYFERN